MNIVIVGGGMVGAAAALCAARQGHQVHLIEAGAAPKVGEDWDIRISSIHQHNVQWLTQLGVFARLHDERHLPYTGLSVTSADGVQVDFEAATVGAEKLGEMIENNALQTALWELLAEFEQVNLCPQQRVVGLDLAAQTITTNEQDYSFDLLIAADGANSMVARLAGIGFRGWDYGWRCLLANVETEQAIPAATWEVFRPQQRGPFALLPLAANKACLIDYRREQEWLSLAEPAQIETALKEQFEPLIGHFTLEQFGHFPLRRQRALQYSLADKIVLVGDAAHSIHPLAGQGVNLGFADVQALFRLVQAHPLAAALQAYGRERTAANQQMMRAMDLIHFGFNSQHWLARVPIHLGLNMVKRQAWAQKLILKEAMGFNLPEA